MINNEELDKVIEKLEHILEQDSRTFSNQSNEDGWYYDEIHAAYKMLKNTWTKQYNKEQE